MSAATERGAHDIGEILDAGIWSTTQKLFVVLSAVAIVLDGFDALMIGYAAPAIIKQWHIAKPDFAPVVAAGLFGMAIGSLVAGFVGDRFGRRNAMVVNVLLLGAATIAVGFSPNVTVMALVRFVAGLGIGGVLPSATTLAAEFTPLRHRALTVTATIVCYPLGGMLAGFFASFVLVPFGWHALFIIGGMLPVAYAVLLVTTASESPRFLARHPNRWPELGRLLTRMGRPIGADASFIDGYEQKVLEQAAQRSGFGSLFEGSMARDTLALWASFFFTLLALYSAVSWLPTLLAAQGLTPGVATAGLTAYNLGGVVGALACAVAISRFGSRWPMTIFAIGSALSAFAALWVPFSDTNLVVFVLGVNGLFTNAVQSTLYALSAFLYPTLIRARGTATALAFGRLGAILSAFTGAALIASGGAAGFLTVLGGAMVIVAVALMVVGRHIVPAARPAARLVRAPV